MKVKRVNDGYFIVLEKGEEIVKVLTDFCYQYNVKSGLISGVGGTNNVLIKYYDIEKREYIPKSFSGKNYEIISLNGNISEVDGKPFVHIHTIIGDSDYRTFGGHLGSAIIGITCEIILTMTDDVINRKLNDEFKLNFWEL
jgi:uncharacterized protein